MLRPCVFKELVPGFQSGVLTCAVFVPAEFVLSHQLCTTISDIAVFFYTEELSVKARGVGPDVGQCNRWLRCPVEIDGLYLLFSVKFLHYLSLSSRQELAPGQAVIVKMCLIILVGI